MYAKVQTIAQIIESKAPKHLAESWDNIGLQVGDPSHEVKKVLVSLDATNEVIDEAEAKDIDMIVTHHPLIFNPLKSINKNLPLGKKLYKLIKKDISLYVAHTNFDITSGGINDILAQKLGLKEIQPLQITSIDSLKKLVVFVPKGHEDRIRTALASAGAGWIGNYSHCTFQVEGTGTFMPLKGSEPFIGEIGRLEKVEEYRLETIVHESKLNKAVRAIISSHPYEEVAYDVYSLDNEGRPFGLGRVGRLPHKVTLKELIEMVKNVMEVDIVKVAGNLRTEVDKVAICGGSGASAIHQAHFKGSQVLITGDVKYHQAQEAVGLGLSIIDIGHWESERFAVAALCEIIKKGLEDLKSKTEVLQSETEGKVFEYC